MVHKHRSARTAFLRVVSEHSTFISIRSEWILCLFYGSNSLTRAPPTPSVPPPQSKRVSQKVRSGKASTKATKLVYEKQTLMTKRKTEHSSALQRVTGAAFLRKPVVCKWLIKVPVLHTWQPQNFFMSSLLWPTYFLDRTLVNKFFCFAYYRLCGSVYITPVPTKSSWHARQPTGKIYFSNLLSFLLIPDMPARSL